MTTQTIAITLMREDGGLRLHLRSPLGESRVLLDHVDLDALHAAALGLGEGADARAAGTLGCDLFDLVWGGDRRATLAAAHQLLDPRTGLLRLRVQADDPALVALPWELMRAGPDEEFLALHAGLSVARYLGDGARPRPPGPRPLRLLAVGASPRDLPAIDLDAEQQRLAATAASSPELVELTWIGSGRCQAVFAALAQTEFDVVHFLGHGVADDGGTGGLFLCDDQDDSRLLTALDLARLLADRGGARLVVLNVCAGASVVGATATSLAATLVRRGVPAVIAMQRPITTPAAAVFTETFYGALLTGGVLDHALRGARRAMSLADACGSEWSTPVLYLGQGDDVVLYARDADRARQPVDPQQLAAQVVGLLGAAGALSATRRDQLTALLAREIEQWGDAYVSRAFARFKAEPAARGALLQDALEVLFAAAPEAAACVADLLAEEAGPTAGPTFNTNVTNSSVGQIINAETIQGGLTIRSSREPKP